MFSATFPTEIQLLAREFLHDYLFLTIGIIGAASSDVVQEVIQCARNEKRDTLLQRLQEFRKIRLERSWFFSQFCCTAQGSRVLIFVETKREHGFHRHCALPERRTCFYLLSCDLIFIPQFKATTIHGDRLQAEREKALGDFRSGARPYLVATSVAARGLDIPGVTHVINYDMPKEVDEYVHRIGRTGRVGNTGAAITFFDADQDGGQASALKDILANV